MYSEIAIFKRDSEYLVLFPKINFWMKTNKTGLIVLRNLRSGEIGEKELRLKSIIENGAQQYNPQELYKIELIEFEFPMVFSFDKFSKFLDEIIDITAPPLSLGVIFSADNFLPNMIQDFPLWSKIDHIEYDCKNYPLSADFVNLNFGDSIKSIHIKNIVLENETINRLVTLKRKREIDIVIYANCSLPNLYEYINMCATYGFYFSVNFDTVIMDYLGFYQKILTYISSREWDINYKKYCAIFNYENIVKSRGYRVSCGIGRDKIYIDRYGRIYSCQDCAHRHKLLLGKIGDGMFASTWQNGRTPLFIRKLTVDEIPKCKECCFRYLCGGQCRMQSYDKYREFKSCSCYCEDEKTIILDLLWKTVEKNAGTIQLRSMAEHI